jgi:hypothetical protein
MAGEARRARKRALLHITREEVFASANWITDRDRQICIDLYKHHVLTIHQLSELHFTQPRKARKRLLTLYERHVVQRFQPRRARGSAPFHYVLGELGAYVVAGHYDLDLKRIRKRIIEDQKLAHRATLPHLLEVHDFFVTLIARCRDAPGHRLARWWSEKRCAAEWCDTSDFEKRPIVRPDAHGILQAPPARCSFFLELDRGTQRGGRLAAKLNDYNRIAESKTYSGKDAASRYPDVLLFLFPSENRELHARRHLFSYRSLCVATSHRQLHCRDPFGTNWAPVQWDDAFGDDDRLRLIDLPSLNEFPSLNEEEDEEE